MTCEVKIKDGKTIRITVVSYEQFSEWDFIDPATWFIVNASQQFVYFHTADRAKAQEACNNLYGDGFYKVKTSKMQKSKSKLESGGLSCTGTTTRRGQGK